MEASDRLVGVFNAFSEDVAEAAAALGVQESEAQLVLINAVQSVFAAVLCLLSSCRNAVGQVLKVWFYDS